MTQKQLFSNSSGRNLTDGEFLHYHSLYNTDPVVQRLCSMDFVSSDELDNRISDLECELSDSEYECDGLRDRIEELEEEVADLNKKLLVWATLSDE